MTVCMCSLDDDGHDLDVRIEAYGQEACLAGVIAALPNHVWYRWHDNGTRENGRNQDVFPWESEDWDETPTGRKFYICDGLSVEDEYGPPPLYKNLVPARRIRTARQLAASTPSGDKTP